MATIEFNGVWKQFPDGTEAVRNLTLAIEDGEFVVLVGPSGCGKSTALRMVAGLEELTAGEIVIGDRVVNHVTPKDRDVAMVFQSYALYPHMSVRENMGFALKLSRTPQREIDRRVWDVAETLGLTELLERRPKALSGGQRQRVAMGRAIVRSPKGFLMDEPLSNLDAKLRVAMRAEVAHLQDRLGVTTLYVTHDQVEAMTMGDRVAVLKRGELMQFDSPQALYERPEDVFVAGFIGSPPMNLCEASIEACRGELFVNIGSTRWPLSDAAIEAYPRLVQRVGQLVGVGMRPEHFFRPDASVPRDRCMDVDVVLVEQLGSESLVHFSMDARPLISADVREAVDDADAFAKLEDTYAAGSLTFTTRLAPRETPVDEGKLVLAFRGDEMHFFDYESGAALR